MFKTYAKHSTEKSRTITISINGKVRFITPKDKAAIINKWRSAGGARFTSVLGGQVSEFVREFDLYESPEYAYVIHCHDAGLDTLQIVASNLSLIDATAAYRNNPSWVAV